MPIHVIRRGECAAVVGARYGVTAEAIFARPGNAGLRRVRANPYILCPGDVLDVPEPVRQKHRIRPGAHAAFRANFPKTLLEMTLRDPDGSPIGNKRYEIEVANKIYPGSTDLHGVVRCVILVYHTHALMRLWMCENEQPVEFELLIGGLDDHHKESGIIHRLHNLGYGSLCENLGLAAALEQFQRDVGVTPTGKMDASTLQHLLRQHGC